MHDSRRVKLNNLISARSRPWYVPEMYNAKLLLGQQLADVPYIQSLGRGGLLSASMNVLLRVTEF